MSTDIAWQAEAECFEHPELPADAWMELGARGAPSGPGAKAALVCRFVCPVREECRSKISGSAIIAGGGWWTRDMEFIEPPRPGLVTIDMAAAYVGIPTGKARTWLRRTWFQRGRSWYSLDDVRRLAAYKGPSHGSMEMHQLHYYRGEVPCSKCRDVAAAMVLVA